jgi:hypothetical protein
MPPSTRGNVNGLLVVDLRTGWLEVVPLPNHRAATLIDAFDSAWRPRFGVPKVLHYDQAAEHVGKKFQAYLDKHGITGAPTTRHSHRSNLAERHIRTVKDRLNKLTLGKPETWDVRLADALFSIRTTVSATRGFSPFQLTYGVEAATHNSFINWFLYDVAPQRN